MAKETAAQRIVKTTIKEVSAFYGASWGQMSYDQRLNAVAAKLFFVISSNADVNESVRSSFINELHAALVTTV